MNKKLLLIIFSLIFISSSVMAQSVYINDDGDYAVDADKFIPQTGVRVKNSALADKLENSTRNAMEGKKGKSDEPPTVRRAPQQQNSKFKKTYKWF